MKPLIVTAELGKEDHAWLDTLRKLHFPPERNHLAAHLTMFHQMPPSAETELRRLFSELARSPAPRAQISGLLDLGGGTAFRIASEELDQIRARIADRMHGLLTAQDSGGWVPHVTVQNKVHRADAITLARALDGHKFGEPVRISGLGIHRYLGGPWEPVAIFPFRGG